MSTTLEIGQRVQMTPFGYRQRMQGRFNRWKGTVVGVKKWPLVRVQRDGEAYRTTWHANFWEPLKPIL